MDKKDTLTDRIKSYGIAGLFYLSGITADYLATAYNNRENGAIRESNPITKYFMDNLGVDEGLLLKSGIEVGIILPFSYRGRRLLIVSSKNFLYFCGVVHFIGAATHLPYIIEDYF